MPDIEYSAASQLRRPRQFVRVGLQSLRASPRVAQRLFLRSVRSQHRLTVLGYAWLFIPALAQILLWSFLNASNIVNAGPTGIPYLAYVIIGVFLWQAFVDGLNGPLRSLGGAAHIISRVSFPIESLLLAGLAEALLNTAARVILLVPVLIYYDVSPSATLVLAPIAAFTMISVGFGAGLILAPFGMLYQDVGRALPVVTQFLFLVTPVAYAFPKEGLASRLDHLNPLSPVLEAGREWLTGGPALPTTGFYITFLLAAAAVTFGWLLLRLSLPHLVDRIGT